LGEEKYMHTVTLENIFGVANSQRFVQEIAQKPIRKKKQKRNCKIVGDFSSNSFCYQISFSCINLCEFATPMCLFTKNILLYHLHVYVYFFVLNL